MVWLIEDAEIVAEIEKQNDRGACLVATAFLDNQLYLTLGFVLEDQEKVRNKLFKGSGPLATFSAKIDLGYMLAMYPDYMHSALHTVRRIRNEFAHSAKPITFETQQIRDLCGNLFPPHTHERFQLSFKEAMAVLTASSDQLNIETKNRILTDAIMGGEDTPRTRFLNSVRSILLHLHLIVVCARLRNVQMRLEPKLTYWPWPNLEKMRKNKQQQEQSKTTDDR